MTQGSPNSAPPYRQITVEDRDGVFCVRLRHSRMDESQLHDLGDELINLARNDGCRKLALSLGDPAPYCLYSVFLGLLVRVRRELGDLDCAFVLCDVAPDVYEIFAASQMDRLFAFVDDFDDAEAHFAAQ